MDVKGEGRVWESLEKKLGGFVDLRYSGFAFRSSFDFGHVVHTEIPASFVTSIVDV